MEDPPVTVYVSRRIKPGCSAAFEEIIEQMTLAAESFDGYLGANIFRPESSDDEYRIIYKFDHLTNLQRWEKSPIRDRLLKKAENLAVAAPNTQILTGLETWFTLPAKRMVTPPSRFKMAIVTWLAIFPLISTINFVFAPILLALPGLIRSLVLTAVLVPIMTYLVMPRMTKLFEFWLYPKH